MRDKIGATDESEVRKLTGLNIFGTGDYFRKSEPGGSTGRMGPGNYLTDTLWLVVRPRVNVNEFCLIRTKCRRTVAGCLHIRIEEGTGFRQIKISRSNGFV